MNLLDFEEPVAPAPLEVGLKPIVMTIEDYEQHWETIEKEESLEFATSKVHNELDFKKLVKAININVRVITLINIDN